MSPVFSISTTIFPSPARASKSVPYVLMIRALPLNKTIHLIIFCDTNFDSHIINKHDVRSLNSEGDK